MHTDTLTLRRFRRNNLISARLRIFFFSLAESADIKKQQRDTTELLASRLLDSYGNAILRTAYSYLHNMQDAEEILQDTLLKYLEKLPRLENSKHEKAWLLTVAANLSKNKLKHNRLIGVDELQETLCAAEETSLAFVWEAVKSLPTQYREALHLYYHEGFSIKEISKILKKNESTVRSDLKRGREKLKEVLKEAYDFE